MASESVGILIEADDQASAKLQQVADNADRQVKRIKEVGRGAKASTEFVGSLSNALGGTQLGGFAGQLAQLTERISNFSEVSKAGGAGALLFKAGLVAAAGVATYKIAESIASWWFEADRWKTAMEEGAKAAAKAQDAFDKARQKKFSEDQEKLSLIRDPDEREAETLARAKQLEKQASDQDELIAKQKAAIAEESKRMSSWATAAGAEQLELSKKNLETLEKTQQEYQEEAERLKDTVSAHAKYVEQKKAENAEKDKSQSFLQGLREEVALLKASKEERIAIEAAKNATVEDRSEAEKLLREKAALLEKAEAQKKADAEAEQARRKAEADAQRVADLKEREIANLERQRIELDKGKEAAHAFALEQQGLDKATAERIAKEQEVIDRRKAGAKETNISATQGRLLTGGRGGADPIQKLQQTAERQAKAAELAADKLEKIYQEEKRKGKPLTMEVVG